MSRRRILALALAITACAAFVPAAANAEWFVEGSKLSGSASIGAEASGTSALESTVLGSPLKMTFTGWNCSGCVISNPGNEFAGKLQLTGLSIVSPAGCTTASSITTNPLAGSVIMHPSGGTVTFMKLTAASGITIFQLKISGCAAAGTYNLTGTLTCQNANPTGVQATVQSMTCGPSAQTTGGAAITLGPNVATLPGAIDWFLINSWAGKKFDPQ